MGSICSICAESNPAFTATGSSLEENSEKSICLAEKKCPMSKKQASAIRNSLKEESFKGRLSLSQIKRAGGNLGFDKSDFQNPDSATYVFISSLGDSEYTDEKLMFLSGVLISNSSAKDKSNSLFEFYDKNSEKILKKDDVHQLLSDCFDISVNNLPKLANSNSKLLSEGINTYTEKLVPHKEAFVNTSANNVLKEQPEISQKRFAEIIEKEFSTIVSSTGIRTEVYKKYVI